MGEDWKIKIPKDDMIFTVPEFRKIITRDKGSDGDCDGRKKLKAIKDFTFLFHYKDPRSSFSGYDDDERLRVACETAELVEREVNADQDLWAACDKYQEILDDYSPMMSTLRTARKMNTQLKVYLESIDFTERDKKGALVYNVGQVIDSVAKLKGLEKVISEVEKDVIDSLKDDRGGIRGAAEKTENDDRKHGRSFSEAKHNPFKITAPDPNATIEDPFEL